MTYGDSLQARFYCVQTGEDAPGSAVATWEKRVVDRTRV
jgi:hypothetical protein